MEAQRLDCLRPGHATHPTHTPPPTPSPAPNAQSQPCPLLRLQFFLLKTHHACQPSGCLLAPVGPAAASAPARPSAPGVTRMMVSSSSRSMHPLPSTS